MKLINLMWIILLLLCFITGLLCGIISQQIATRTMIAEFASNLDGVKIDIDLNETMMVDAMIENFEEMGLFDETNESFQVIDILSVKETTE